MPINRLLKHRNAKADDVERLKLAYALALRSLSLVDRNDPLTELIAKEIIEVGATVHDPTEIASLVVKKLGI